MDGGEQPAKPKLSLKGLSLKGSLKRPDDPPGPGSAGGPPPPAGAHAHAAPPLQQAAAPSSSALSGETAGPRPSLGKLSLKSRLSLKGVPAGSAGTPAPAPSGGFAQPAAAAAAAAAAATPGRALGHSLSLKTHGAATPSTVPRPPAAASTPAASLSALRPGSTPLSSSFSRPAPPGGSVFESSQKPHQQQQQTPMQRPKQEPVASPFVAASQAPLPSVSSQPAMSGASGDNQAKKPRLTLKMKLPLGGGGGGGRGLGGGGSGALPRPAGGGGMPRPAAVPAGRRAAGGLGGGGGVYGGGGGGGYGGGAPPQRQKMLVKVKVKQPLNRTGTGGPGSGPLHHARSAAPSAAPGLGLAPPRMRPIARPGPPPLAMRPAPGAGLHAGVPMVVEAAGAKRSSSGVMEIQPARAAKRPRLGTGSDGEGEGGDDDEYVPPKRPAPAAFLQRHGSLAQVRTGPRASACVPVGRLLGLPGASHNPPFSQHSPLLQTPIHNAPSPPTPTRRR
jgi:hypothetical protein